MYNLPNVFPHIYYCGKCNQPMANAKEDTVRCSGCTVTESRVTFECPVCHITTIETVQLSVV